MGWIHARLLLATFAATALTTANEQAALAVFVAAGVLDLDHTGYQAFCVVAVLRHLLAGWFLRSGRSLRSLGLGRLLWCRWFLGDLASHLIVIQAAAAPAFLLTHHARGDVLRVHARLRGLVADRHLRRGGHDVYETLDLLDGEETPAQLEAPGQGSIANRLPQDGDEETTVDMLFT